MSTPKVELCQIRKEIGSGGGFGGVEIFYIAEKATAKGAEVIAQSKKVVSRQSWMPGVWKPPIEQLEVELHQQVLNQLVSEGWEPAGTDEHGRVTALKRTAVANKNATSSEPAELLRQLASLRDAGILTQEEFDRKKAEILKRL